MAQGEDQESIPQTIQVDPIDSRQASQRSLSTSPTSHDQKNLRTVTSKSKILLHTKNFFQSLLNPPSLSILIAIPISVVPALKALFVPVEGVRMPPAPDGQPPLAFIMDIATFLGNAAVPLGLLCLGAAIANIQLPRGNFRALPLGAIFALAILKMLVMPVIGVAITNGLIKGGLIDMDDKVLRFVCVYVLSPFRRGTEIRSWISTRFFSCLPAATTQVWPLFPSLPLERLLRLLCRSLLSRRYSSLKYTVVPEELTISLHSSSHSTSSCSPL
jgi:hypothetical protein